MYIYIYIGANKIYTLQQLMVKKLNSKITDRIYRGYLSLKKLPSIFLLYKNLTVAVKTPDKEICGGRPPETQYIYY